MSPHKSLFQFGGRSKSELVGVHPRLVEVCHAALKLSPVDFGVHDGLRTMREQEEYVRTGVSKTMRSRHLKQEDGFGHAVDLVPYINGKLRWEWPAIYLMAEAVHEAATQLEVRLTWGAVWDRELAELDPTDLESEVQSHVARRKTMGRKAFLDGPHFQLVNR